jgi:hypothetical protein
MRRWVKAAPLSESRTLADAPGLTSNPVHCRFYREELKVTCLIPTEKCPACKKKTTRLTKGKDERGATEEKVKKPC